jgi:hypothetical protein
MIVINTILLIVLVELQMLLWMAHLLAGTLFFNIYNGPGQVLHRLVHDGW